MRAAQLLSVTAMLVDLIEKVLHCTALDFGLNG